MKKIILLFAGGAALCWLVVRVRLLFARRGLDRPGHRSLHTAPVPHGGGLGIVAAALTACLYLGVPAFWPLAILALALVSMLDDAFQLPFWLRLAVHLGVTAYVLSQIASGLPLWQWCACLLIVAWATNAYNFMDGADGLAGSMTAVGFGAYALVLAQAANDQLAGVCVAVVGASLAFLSFNWHPAKIFAGDVGAIPLGFMAGAFGVYGVLQHVWPAWFAPIVFAPFLADATVTLLRRALRGERVWQAHREHYYQRMVLMDGRHDRVCRQWIALMLGSAALAVLVLRGAPALGLWVLAFWMAVLAVLGLWVDWRWRAHALGKRQPAPRLE